MCGRYVSVRSDADLTDEFDAIDATQGLWPAADFNVAPTKPVRVVLNRPLRAQDGTPAPAPTRQLRVVSWGLVPSWSKDRKGQGRMINARSETVATAGAFRRAYAARRCLVPADGWFEWQRIDTSDGVRKQAMYMTPGDGHCLAFAGLYEFWRDPATPAAPVLATCAVLTTAAQGHLAEIHDRMPVVLGRDAWQRWLDPAVADPADLLTPHDEAAAEQLELRPVSSLVNKVDNNGPHLLERAEPEPVEQKLF